MELKSTLKKLESSKEFKEWRKSNKDDYFSYAISTIESNNQTEWQLGYYNKKNDKLTTFMFDNGNIRISPEEEVFKRPDMEVNKIDLKRLKLSFDFILKKIDNLLKNDYSKELVIKKIIILQNIEKFGNIWNVTCVSQSFNVINAKIDIENGNVVEHKSASIFEFKKSS